MGLTKPRKTWCDMIKVLLALASATILMPSLRADTACESLAAPFPVKSFQARLQNEIKVAARDASFRNDLEIKGLPQFCRISLTLAPHPESEIGSELWFPVSGWNGRYLQIGNRGFAGTIPHEALAHYLKLGYAVGGSDNGHRGYDDDASWAVGQVEKIHDFAYRAVHETRRAARGLLKQFYAQEPKHSYFSGCSEGGREALVEAQRYPEDFDGYLAGAPAASWTYGYSGLLFAAQRFAAMKGETLTLAQIGFLSKEALRQCDGLDGVKDGLIERPRQCRFDSKRLLCKGKGKEKTACFSENQRRLVDDLHLGVPDAQIAGFRDSLGVEDDPFQWPTWFTGPTLWNAPDPIAKPLAQAFFANMVYGDPKRDVMGLDIRSAARDAADRWGAILNVREPHLKGIATSGKKILQYHGWADVAVPAQYSLDYYEYVKKEFGPRSSDFYRLFMVPGMAHCFGGKGASVFNGIDNQGAPRQKSHDALLALEAWVEKGEAPETLIGTQYIDGNPEKGVRRTRLLCPYPAYARWNKKGSVDKADSFVCVND